MPGPFVKAPSSIFFTAAIGIPDFATPEDFLRAALGALADGADAVMTARSMKVVRASPTRTFP